MNLGFIRYTPQTGETVGVDIGVIFWLIAWACFVVFLVGMIAASLYRPPANDTCPPAIGPVKAVAENSASRWKIVDG